MYLLNKKEAPTLYHVFSKVASKAGFKYADLQLISVKFSPPDKYKSIVDGTVRVYEDFIQYLGASVYGVTYMFYVAHLDDGDFLFCIEQERASLICTTVDMFKLSSFLQLVYNMERYNSSGLLGTLLLNAKAAGCCHYDELPCLLVEPTNDESVPDYMYRLFGNQYLGAATKLISYDDLLDAYTYYVSSTCSTVSTIVSDLQKDSLCMYYVSCKKQ